MKKKIIILPVLLFFLVSLSFGQMSNTGNQLIEQAETHFISGEFNEALVDFNAALESFKVAGAKNDAYRCTLKIAETQTRLGNASSSLALCIALEKENQTDDLLIAESFTTKGNALLHLGRNAEAIEYLVMAENKFLPIAKENPAPLANCYNDLGIAYWNNGNNNLALQYLQNALNLREETLGQQHPEVGDTYNNIGLVHAADNTYAAVIYFNSALTIYQSVYQNNHPKIAITLNNLALQFDAQEDYEKALEYLNRVASVWEALFPENHPNKAFTDFSIANILYHKKEFEQALVYERKALQTYKTLYGEKHPEIANVYNLEGNIYVTQGEFKKAIESFQKALFANLADQPYMGIYDNPKIDNYYNADILLNSLQQKSNAFESLHYEKTMKFRDLKAALACLELADELVSHMRQIRLGEKDKLALSAKASEIYEAGVTLSYQMSTVVLKPRYYKEKAFYFSEKSKSSVLLSAIQDTNAKSYSGIPEELLNTEKQLKSDVALLEQQLATNTDINKESSLKKELLEMNSQYNTFIKDLETDYPSYFNLKYSVNHISISELQSSMNESTALITHFITATRVYTFYVSSKKFQVTNTPKIENFDKQISGLKNAIKFEVKDAFIRSSSILYKQLFPIKIEKNIDQLIIIPEGLLSSIPFEALLTTDKKIADYSYSQLPYLFKKYNISYDNSATLFHQRNKEMEVQENRSEDILLVAPINFSSTNYEGLPNRLNDLPGSENEINEIKYLFKAHNKSADLLTAENANREAIVDKPINHYKYIHFATHGMVNQSEPELSRIFLHDGSLYSGEIYNIEINADLVCLSACETGLGKISKGEGIIGLSRALLYAGAKNLVVSLWTVADESTSKLMIDFYNNQLNSSTYNTYSRALRKAKLTLVQDEKYSSPYYWAPFILIGE